LTNIVGDHHRAHRREAQIEKVDTGTGTCFGLYVREDNLFGLTDVSELDEAMQTALR